MDPEYGSPQPVAPKEKRLPIARKGLGTKGSKITLLSNHFKVNIGEVDGHLYRYSVNLMYEDGFPVNAKGVAGVGRKIIEMVKETYAIELGGKDFAYDGEKSLYTVGSLPNNKLEFTVSVRDKVSSRYLGNTYPPFEFPSASSEILGIIKRHCQAKKFIVQIRFAAKIPMQAIADAVNGHENENTKEALRVLDIVLRQHAARQGCLLVNQSYFFHDSRHFANVGGGALRCMGFHSSFRDTQAGLSLNIDVTSAMIVHPGPLVEFLFKNQNVTDPGSIDWDKAKRMLKNLRIKTATSYQEFKITGLSEFPCKEQTFTLKQRNHGGDLEDVEITVYDYFFNVLEIPLFYSGEYPCINVGKPKRPTFIPLELCTLVSLQRYTKALTNLQRASFVRISNRQKPQDRKKALSQALKTNNYDAEPMLRSCGISISKDFVQIQGRLLHSPKIKSGTDDFFPRDGSWDLYNKRLVEPTKITGWSVVNFSVLCNSRDIVTDLIRVGGKKGVKIDPPFEFIEEKPQFKRDPPVVRVEKMFEEIKSKLRDRPRFLLCLLPESKNCDIYGPWKKGCMSDLGIVTQCMAPMTAVVHDLYLSNLLLKINAKLGGLNSMLAIECTPDMPLVSNLPTLILGMDVSHGSPGRSDVPSIAAVVSSRAWPSISRYRATVRTRPPKVEMIDNLFKPVSDTEDEGIIRELLIDFYRSSGHRKPQQIIIFRDGVSESQFNQVLNIELDQIIEACKFLDKEWDPKFVYIVAQKNHHTRFFQQLFPDNIPPGTIIDSEVCHPRNYDFYLCAHSAKIGTARPTHYHVLHDEIGISPDDLQELVHNLSYVYQRSTSATSIVSPLRYAHLAAAYMAQWLKSEEAPETSSGHGSMTAAGSVPLLQLPRLHRRVSSSMFFC